MRFGIDARAASWYRGTGIGTYTSQLARNLCLLDRINQYLFFYPNTTFDEFEVQENIDIKAISQMRSESFWEEVDIPNLLADTEIDAYLVPQNGIGLPKEKNCPFLITLHDVIPYKMPETVGPQYLEIFLREVPSILERCDAILTVSDYSKADIMSTFHLPAEKLFTTHLAAEEIYFPRNKLLCKQLIQTKYGISSDFILYVGGFSPRKNIKGLIRAFQIAQHTLPSEMQLVILGKKGRSYYEYRDLATSLGLKDAVVFPGYVPVDELPLFYNAATVFCYPSFYEGFGLPPLEAMACGTPTISSCTTSMPEILGDATIYINPYNEADMAEKLEQVINDKKLQQDLCFRGLRQSIRYSWKNTALETLFVLQQTATTK